MLENEFVLGIDGGGTGSRCVALAANGDVLHRATAGPLNFYSTSDNLFRENLQTLRAEASVRIGLPCAHTVVGTAALLHQASAAERQRATEGCGDSSPEKLTLLGDALTTAFGATAGSFGVLVIAGTGSVAIGIDENGRQRLRGGFGPFIGSDPGSAVWLAAQGIFAAQDNPELAELVCAHFEIEKLTEVIPLLYGENFDTPKLASLAEHLSENPVEEWIDIEEQAGRELTKLARTLHSVIREPHVPVFAAGSVLLKNPRVRKSLEQNLGCFLESPRLDPETGAALLALRRAGGQITDGLISALRDSNS